MSDAFTKVQLGFVVLMTVLYLLATMPAHAEPRRCGPVTFEPNDPAHLINPYGPVTDYAHDRRAIA